MTREFSLSDVDVSVVIPAYNCDTYIQSAIESVLSQKKCNFELIVVNDGSSDRTSLVIQPYQSHLRYFYQENRGVSTARNLGIENARGEYIAFLDADDYFLPDKLSEQLELFREDASLGLVHSGWQRVDSSGNILAEVCPWQQFPTLDLVTWLQHKPVLPSAMMFKRQWLQQVGGFDPKLAAAEDVDLVLRLAIAGCQSQWLPKVTVAYRQHGKSAMGNGLLQADCLAKMLDKVFSHPSLPSEAQLIEQKVRYGTLVWAAWYLYCTGYPQAMVEQLKQAYGRSPKLPTIALIEWVERFEAFSKNIDEEFSINSLIHSEVWQELRYWLLSQQQQNIAP